MLINLYLWIIKRLKYLFEYQPLYFQLVTIICLALLVNSFKPNEVGATTQSVDISTNVQQYLSMAIIGGNTVSFGNLTPGTPIAAPSDGTIVSVTTNAANGYSIGLSDASDNYGSALLHTDSTTRITDYASIFASPTTWTGTGLGVTLFAADSNKDTNKWGTGTSYNHANNKYAGIPQNTTVAHTVTGYRSGADTSSWAWKLDVPNTQKTGAYSGTVTFTATAVLTDTEPPPMGI